MTASFRTLFISLVIRSLDASEYEELTACSLNKPQKLYLATAVTCCVCRLRSITSYCLAAECHSFFLRDSTRREGPRSLYYRRSKILCFDSWQDSETDESAPRKAGRENTESRRQTFMPRLAFEPRSLQNWPVDCGRRSLMLECSSMQMACVGINVRLQIVTVQKSL